MATPDLPDASPTSAKNPKLVQDMFDRVAPKYDLANAVMSLGSDEHWRRVTVRRLNVHPGMKILDVATGTAPLASQLAGAGASVIGLDFSWNMLAAGAIARQEAGLDPLPLINGDGNRMPFADNTFDAITIGFGLRNFPDTIAALTEFKRVLKPNGKVAILEFSAPTNPIFATIYRDYLVAALPALAKFVTSDPAAYNYLAESIMKWPNQRQLATLLSKNGWEQPRWQNMTGGIVTLHMANKPAITNPNQS